MENINCKQKTLSLTTDNFAISFTRSQHSAFPPHDANKCAIVTPLTTMNYAALARSPATSKAIATDIKHFVNWGGTLPASAGEVAAYITHFANRLAVTTLKRRLSSISQAHLDAGWSSPTGDQLVTRTLKGIKRVHRQPIGHAKPFSVKDVIMIISEIQMELADHRDKAIILLGFAGAFRRSELCSIDVGNVEITQSGVVVYLHKSKIDQFGAGRTINVPRSGKKTCPATALCNWLEASGIVVGPIFRSIDRHGNISDTALSDQTVSRILKYRASAAGLDTQYISGHSLRAGYATSAALQGISTWEIRKQTGHRSGEMVDRYVRLARINQVGEQQTLI